MHGRYVGSWDRGWGDVILRIAGSGFPGLPPLLCCSGPVGLAYLGAFVHGGTPLGPVHGGLIPGVGGDGKRFQGCFTCVEQRGNHYCPVHLQLGL